MDIVEQCFDQLKNDELERDGYIEYFLHLASVTLTQKASKFEWKQ